MDTQTLINTLFGLVCALAGWFGRELWTVVKGLQREIADFRLEVARDYVPRSDMKDFVTEMRTFISHEVRELRGDIGRVFDKLDQKQDKL